MGWFKKAKPLSGLETVQLYSRVVYAQITEAEKLLAKTDIFDPQNPTHRELFGLIMSLTSHLPETRIPDTRNLDWSESRVDPFKVCNRRMDRDDWFFYGFKVYYKDQTVLDWENCTDTGEVYRTVRLGPWCYELFDLIRQIRQETEDFVITSQREEAVRKAEYESLRFQPLK